MEKTAIQPSNIWHPGEHLFSQATLVRNAARTLYLAGQTSIDERGTIVGVGDVEQQIRLSFNNIATIVGEVGGTLHNVVKLTAYFTDISSLPVYTRVLGELFPEVRPSQTVVQVVSLAMPELLVEIDATAALD